MLRGSEKWLLLFILSGCGVVWAWNSTTFWWFYDSDSLYAPIFVRPFDPYIAGATVEGNLHERFSTEYALMLVFDKEVATMDDVRGMNAKFHLTFLQGKQVLQEKNITISDGFMQCLGKSGAEFWLERFDLPFPNNDSLRFRLTVLEPVTFPNGGQPAACCMVRVAYHL